MLIPGLAPKIETFAKKLRDAYFREGSFPEQKTYLDPLRERQPEDTITKVVATRGFMPAVIKARDEFPDIDLVFPWRVPFMMRKNTHTHTMPWYIRYNDEEIRVTCQSFDYYFKTQEPYMINFQRYIVGKPNLLCLPLHTVQEDKSFHWQAGADFEQLIKEVWVWCFTDKYIPRLEINCQEISPTFPVKLGDIEKMLPYGMYLHKKYSRQLFHSVAKLRPTNLYIQRKNMVVEQESAIREQRKKSEFSGDQKQKRVIEVKEKQVPEVAQSAKFLTAAKKELDKQREKEAAEKKKK